MRVLLLALSGDTASAHENLCKRYAHAEIEDISRAEFESGSILDRLKSLRSRRPELFAILTERLAWQRGQNALMLFGAMAGAKRVLLLDSHGAMREESRSEVLLNAPRRLAHESYMSARALALTRRELKRLESAVLDGASSSQKNREKKQSENKDRRPSKERAAEIVYLRATTGPGTQTGGASSHINGFVNAAKDLGARIRMISNDKIAGLNEQKIPLTVIGPEPVGTTRAAFDLYNNLVFTRGAIMEMENSQPDFIYQRYSRFSWAGVEASLNTRRPLLLEYNGSEVWVGQNWDITGMIPMLERFERLNLAAAARIFVVSEVDRRNLLRAGVSHEKIVVNPNGVDAEKFRPKVGGSRVREELHIKDEETLVGFIGTFGPWHGVLTLAEAIKQIPLEARTRFLLIGDGRLRPETERMVREAGRERDVIFAGQVEHERVPALLDACDVLVSPHVPLADGSDFFGSPTKLFEYMAMGKGIVASRLGQIGDVLRHEETALLVEPGDARALAQAVVRLANSVGLRERLGSAAREEAVARFTWKHNAARVLEAYRDWSEQNGCGGSE